MVILRILIPFLVLMTPSLRAEVELLCYPEEKCAVIKEKFNPDLSDREEVDSYLEKLALDKSIKYLEVRERTEDKILLVVEVKPLIEEVVLSVPTEVDPDQILKISQIQEDVLYNQDEIYSAKERVESWLFERGFLKPKLEIEESFNEEGDVILSLKVSFSQKLALKDVIILGKTNRVIDELLRPVFKLKRDPYSRVTFKLAIDIMLSELKSNGFLHAKIGFKDKIQPPNVAVELTIDPGQRFQFSFYGNKVHDRSSLMLALNNAFSDGTALLNTADISSFIEKYYEGNGLYGTKVKGYEKTGKTAEGVSIKTFFFQIDEGKKIGIKKISFKGPVLVDLEELEDLYYGKGTTLSSRDYLDKKYLENFTSILKDHYLRKGFVFVDISKPRIKFYDNGKEAEVTYAIKERQQSILEEINLNGVPLDYQKKILEQMVNKEGKPLNVIELEKDLSRALNTIREQGFFYATITNLNEDNVVSYELNYTRSRINLNFDTGKLTRLENVVLSGNKVTKDIVLRREVPLRRGDIVTPEVLKLIRDNLNALGLFGSVQILPIITNKLADEKENKVNLVLQVVEKKFGRGEIAPGYRTDIGAKLSFTISRSNLLGYNDSGTLKLQLNRRFSLSQFDPRRAQEKNHKIEGIATLNYRFPHLFEFANFDSSFSVQRRRFYSFDADIFRISPQITKQVTNRINLSLKYQYERIRQFDATELKDRATFEIGSITPGITLDFRDSNISPRKGAYFGLNWEFASPALGSQNNEDIEINFSKVISRNRFYIPVGSRNFVLALSVAGGMQKNYANEQAGFNSDGTIRTRGYIPSIKVFRLDGFDIVRGFADNEINKVDEGEDITSKRIQGKAYFVNFKFEPRYYIDDTLVIGPFFDAGRLFVDTIRPADLRTSTGLTLKFLTPVGTLDFDYGVKLNRQDLGNGNRESFGRFHLSIGYF